MEWRKNLAWGFLCLFIICRLAGTVQAKSLYAITDHHASTLKAYEIQDSNLAYQADVNVTAYATGAADVTIDSELELLFITYEDSPKIVWASAKSLEQQGVIDLRDIYPSAGQLAGIVADEQKQRVYVVERGGSKLYILAWDDDKKELVLMDPRDPNQPYESGTAYVTLTGLNNNSAWGMALDENTRRLYVTDDTVNVHYYDADDPNWTHLGTRNVGRDAADVVVDPNNGQHNAYLYTGALYTGAGGHTYLVKHDLEDPCESTCNTENDIGTVAIGLAVDTDTALVYTTTSSPNIRVYDCSDPCFVCTYSEPTAGSSAGAGICVPTGDVYYKPPAFILEKDYALEPNDPNACALPGYYIAYTITYDANGYEVDDVNIVDYLPPETDFNSADSNGVYDPNYHTVTWQIGTLEPNDSGFVTLTVRVNEFAEPLGTITNFCEIETEFLYSHTEVDINVCSWLPDIIYVDKDAPGPKSNGMSWHNAFTNLQDALERARQDWGSEIRVAAGAYTPDTEPNYNAAFELINGVAVYGGFAGFGEPNPDDRYPHAYETILTGNIAGGYNVNYVVTASDVNETAIIDGFIIEMAFDAGLYSNSASPTITNNKITDNKYYGIYCQNCNDSSVNITNCQILNCGKSYSGGGGIYCYNSNLNIVDCFIDNIRRGNGIHCENDSSVTVRNTQIQNNIQNQNTADNGIYCYQSNLNVINCTIKDSCDYGIYCKKTYSVSILNSRICGSFNNRDGIYIENGMGPVIKNNWISDHRDGICFYSTATTPLVRNTTVADNELYGIRSGGASPSITNCIIWRNNDGQLIGCTATYSCIQDCNYAADPNMHNICEDPLFIDDDPNDPNNYHLDPNSPCINAGDPNADYNGETDIDGEPRVADGRVDMGADEYYWSPADFNDDGIVNFFDYAPFAAAWLTDDPNYSLDDDNDVDINDLAIFCRDWLWQPAWTQQGGMMGQGSSGQDLGLEQEPDVQEPLVEEPDIADTEEPLVEEPDAEEPVIEEFDVEEMVNWLEELWLTNEEVRETTTEQEWLDFIERVKQTPSY